MMTVLIINRNDNINKLDWDMIYFLSLTLFIFSYSLENECTSSNIT